MHNIFRKLDVSSRVEVARTVWGGGVVVGLRAQGEFRRCRALSGRGGAAADLVIEDAEATRAFLVDNLAADGFRVASASSAGEGLRAVETRRPSLVLLDLRLDASSGLDVLDRIRAADGLATRIDPDLPVIVLSGLAGESDRVPSFSRGADDHLCKPMRPDVAAAFDRMAAAARREAGL